MKNATKHAEELRSLYRKLVKEHKPGPRPQMDALQALVRGAMSFEVSDTRAEEAMKAIEREFVDLNELRVATELEVQELLGVRYPKIEKRVMMITSALNAIFEREHTLNLERMKDISKRDSRQFLRDLPEMHPFVEAYVMLMAFDAHAVPLDEDMLAVLRDQEIIDENTTLEEAQRFVEHHLKADEHYAFYAALRAAAAAAESKPKKKAK
jgi:endonuclease III